MKKYRKKPVIIEAVQLTRENYAFVDDWIQRYGGNGLYENGKFIIHTLEGEMIANKGDWIIKGIQDEFYPCKPSIFEMTYEEIVDEDK